MNGMFDTLFNGMMAYQQVLMLVGGFVAASIGALFFGNEIYWRMKAVRVAGIISGVRPKGNVYYPVYRYQLPGGEIAESTSDIGSSGFKGKETGRALTLMVFPDDSSTARPAGNWAFAWVGSFFGVVGLILLYVAFTRYPITNMTWFMAAAMLCYSGMKLQKILIPKGQRPTLSAWKTAMKARHEAEMKNAPVIRIEDVMTSDEGKKAVAQQQKSMRWMGPLFLAAGIAMVMGGVHMGNRLEELMTHGLASPGTVVDVVAGDSTDDVYYPVVSFSDSTGHSHQFRDSVGADPPEFRVGEAVAVRYLAPDPEHTAMIDRGVLNYLFVFAILLFGTVFTVAGAVVTRSSFKKSAASA